MNTLVLTYYFQNLIQNIESVLTIAAILIGGIWTYILFIKNREKYPKADLSQIIQKIDLDDELLIRLTIVIKNVGRVKLPIKSGEVRLQHIKPSNSLIADAIKNFKKNAFTG